MSAKTTSSMLAKGPESGSAGTAATSRPVSNESLLAPDADPGATVDGILALLSEERYSAARRLAAAAHARFPNHNRVQNAWSVFDSRGKAIAGPEASEPNREEEFEWLRNPPESVRGKWVALLGNEMIDAAETLVELEGSLSSRNLPKPALVHYIDWWLDPGRALPLSHPAHR